MSVVLEVSKSEENRDVSVGCYIIIKKRRSLGHTSVVIERSLSQGSKVVCMRGCGCGVSERGANRVFVYDGYNLNRDGLIGDPSSVLALILA